MTQRPETHCGSSTSGPGCSTLAPPRGVNLGARDKVPEKPLAVSLGAELEVPVRHQLSTLNVAAASTETAVFGKVAASSILHQTGLGGAAKQDRVRPSTQPVAPTQLVEVVMEDCVKAAK